MRAILEFDLPKDQMDYKLTNHSFTMYSSLLNIDNILRNYTKYIEAPKIDDLIKEIREELYDSKINEIE